VEALITPSGGQAEATGADGTHYLLDLPAGSDVRQIRDEAVGG
jgi:hypothetical protein